MGLIIVIDFVAIGKILSQNPALREGWQGRDGEFSRLVEQFTTVLNGDGGEILQPAQIKRFLITLAGPRSEKLISKYRTEFRRLDIGVLLSRLNSCDAESLRRNPALYTALIEEIDFRNTAR